MSERLLLGDCLDVLAGLPEASIDACVTDPPYNIKNRTVDVKGCASCGRTLGGADGSPTQCPRCGGPLSYQRSQQGRGAEGVVWDSGVAFRPETWWAVGRVLLPGAHLLAFGGTRTYHRMVGAIEEAGFEIRDCMQWLYGTGYPKPGMLKPACEMIVVARNPLKGSVTKNIEEHGTGALNIDRESKWPANVLLDEYAASILDEQVGSPVSRFYYTTKPSKEERGLDNHHPTVKPVELMRRLVRLVTPPGGVVLDPFMGSGTTGVASKSEERSFIGIEQDAGYYATAVARVDRACNRAW